MSEREVAPDGPKTVEPQAEPQAAPGPAASPAFARLLQRKIARRRRDRKAGGALAQGAGDAVECAAASTGSPLPAALREKFSESLGADLSAVRVHTGADSQNAASAVAAKAYTTGNDIHFGAGQYDPSSSAGQELLAHEVAHTVQQAGSGAHRSQARLEVSEPGDALESEADAAAAAMVRGAPATVTSATPTIWRRVQRTPTGPVDQRASVLDVAGMAHDVRAHLNARLVEARRRITVEPNRERQDLLRQEIARLDGDVMELSTVRSNAAGLNVVRAIAGNWGVQVPERRVRVGGTSQPIDEVSLDGSHIQIARGNENTRSRLGARPEVGSIDSTTNRDVSTTRIGPDGISHANETSVSHDRADRSSDRTTVRQTGAIGYSDGAARITSTDTATESQTAASGASSERSDTRMHGLSYGPEGIGANLGRQRSRTDTNADHSSVATSNTSASSVHAGADSIGGNHATTNRVTHTAADGSTDERTGATSVGGGLIRGEEHGGQFSISTGQSRTQTQHRDEDDVRSPDSRTTSSHSVSTSADGRLTNQGAALGVNEAGAITRGRFGATGNLGAHGSFHIDVTPIPDSRPPRFRVVTRVEFSGGAGVGGSVAGQGRAHAGVSLGVDGSASRSVVITHELSEEEAQRYAAHAREVGQGGAAGGHEAPEFDLMARVRMSGASGALQVLSNPASAASLGAGSSLEMSTTVGGNVHGGLDASIDGAGAGVSASRGATRTRATRVSAIEVRGHRMIQIRLTFNDGRSGSESVRVDGGAATLGAGQSRSQANGSEVTFQLDPNDRDYNARFAEIMAATEPAGAQALAQRLGAEMTVTSENAYGANASVGGGGLTLRGSDEHSLRSSVTVGGGAPGARELSAREQAMTAQGGSLAANNTTIASTRDSTTTDATTDALGHQNIDVNRTQQSDLDVAPQFLRDLFHTAYRDIAQFQLNESDVVELANRARSRDGWFGVLTGTLMLHIGGLWDILGGELRNPQPPREWTAANPAVAVRIARAHSISRFMSQAPSGDGLNALLLVSRGASPSHDLGLHLEWPQGIADRGAQFAEVRARIDGAVVRWPTLADRSQVTREAAQMRSELQTIYSVVQICQTFNDPGAKVETLSAVQAQIRRVDHLQRSIEGRGPTRQVAAGDNATAQANGAAPANAPAPPDAVTPATANPAAANAEDLQRERRERIMDLVRTLDVYKQQELALWERSQSETAAAQGFFASTFSHVNAAIDALDQIAAMYSRWMRDFHTATQLSQEAGGDPSALARLHPNVNWSAVLYQRAVSLIEGMARGQYDETMHQTVARWRQETAG